MSTYCALHIQSEDRQLLLSELEKFLASSHRRPASVTSDPDPLESIYGDEFICSEDLPTRFAVDSGTNGWLVAHYNSFHPLSELAGAISRSLDTLVVSVMAQSVSSAYQIEVWRAGTHLRTLYFAEGDWIRNEGSPLPFESNPLGTNLAEEGEEPYFSFGRSEAIEYCGHLGLRLWQRTSDETQWAVVA